MTTRLDSAQNHLKPAASPVEDRERAEALRELAQRRAAGAVTLGELDEAARRVQAGQSAAELDEAARVVAGPAAAVRGPRRWLVVFLGGHKQRGRWRLGRDLRLVSVLGGACLLYT
jgi:hypothetical protein